MTKVKYNELGELIFEDFPQFKPNLTPKEIFSRGSFGGTYWRPIFSKVTGKTYKNRHLLYPKEWWENINDDYLTQSEYNKSINTYGVKVGSSLEEWETKGWIKEQDPYGWVEWYCNFFIGRRCEDDLRQIKRWQRLAGEKGRFKRRLISLIKSKKSTHDDISISPKIRQTLQHWAYEIKSSDIHNE